MNEAGVGWIAAIIIGGLAVWLAKQFMETNTGLLMNIILGIVGAAVASLLFGFIGVSFGGGCTSGHGVCGIARLSSRSIVATATFMLAAFATIYVARHILGAF